MRNSIIYEFCTVRNFLLLICLVTANSAYSAESHPEMQFSIQIFDESSGIQIPGESLDSVKNSKFKDFISSVSKHVADKIGDGSHYQENAFTSVDIKLYFVYRPLLKSNAEPVNLPIDFRIMNSNATCHLDSPWAKITISRSPKFFMRGEFTWSERQVLIDQALLGGAEPSQVETNSAIESRVFGNYVTDYAESVLLASSPEERASAQQSITERISSDFLWLFRHAWQSTFAPFSMEARHALGLTLERAAPQYLMLVNTLVDRCLMSARGEERHKTILELNGIFNTSAYQINNIH